MSSKIEQVIEEIEAFIAGCKPQMLSNTNIVVNRDQLEEYLTELRMKTPEEIKRYQKIISQKEDILAAAKTKADSIVSEAQAYTTEMVSQHQIMQQAYAQADEVVTIAMQQRQEILDKATLEAHEIHDGAMGYANEMLKNLEEMIEHAMAATRNDTERLIGSLQACYETVSTNRNQLIPPDEQLLEESAQKKQAQKRPPKQAEPEEELMIEIVDLEA